MGTIGSQIGRHFEQKRNTKWVKKKKKIWSRPTSNMTLRIAAVIYHTQQYV